MDETEFAALAAEPTAAPPARSRPVGVTILALLFLITGVGMVALLVTSWSTLLAGLGQIGVSAPMLLYSLILPTILGFVAGAGLWIGRPWGWWAATVASLLNIVRNVQGLLVLLGLVQALDGLSEAATMALVRDAASVIGQSLLLAYFFKGNVLAFCQVGGTSRWHLLLLLAGIVAVVFAIGTLLQMLF